MSDLSDDGLYFRSTMHYFHYFLARIERNFESVFNYLVDLNWMYYWKIHLIKDWGMAISMWMNPKLIINYLDYKMKMFPIFKIDSFVKLKLYLIRFFLVQLIDLAAIIVIIYYLQYQYFLLPTNCEYSTYFLIIDYDYK